VDKSPSSKKEPNEKQKRKAKTKDPFEREKPKNKNKKQRLRFLPPREKRSLIVNRERKKQRETTRFQA
jgi:hypothetical protein